jgi:hypothetical protein
MRRSRSALVAILSLALALLSSAAIAQDATPGATPGGPSGGYPVAVHQGTCDNVTAQPAADIGNATAPGTDQGGDVETVGQQTGPILVVSQGTIDMSMDDLAAGSVIAVHASSDDYETIVACGQIAGVKADDKLVVPLTPIGESTTVGVAILEGGDEVDATVYIFDTAMPIEATPAS